MKKSISITLAIALFAALFAYFLAFAPMALAEAPEETAAPTEPVEYTPVIIGVQEQVHVSTVDELLAALKPDTEIILDAEFYDLSTATGYGEIDGEYYRWQEVFDGVQLTIHDLSNLTIRAEGDDVKEHTVSATPRYAHVLNFENCSDIMLEGFTAGHTIEPAYCAGGVISFANCENTLVNNCGLYGCGVVGVWAEHSKDIQVTNCDIYECSWGGIYMVTCLDVTFNGNTIRDLGEEFMGTWNEGTPFMLHDTKNITINGEKMPNSYIGN